MHTAEWHNRRQLSGGASDLPIVLGVSPYASASPLILAYQKRGVLPSKTEDSSNWYADRMEALGREWAAMEFGAVVTYEPSRDDFVTVCCECGENCDRYSRETIDGAPCCAMCESMTAAHAHANLDGRVLYNGESAVFESKSISMYNPDAAGWKRDGVPLHVRFQVQQQLLCSGLRIAVVCLHNAPLARFEYRIVGADLSMHGFIMATWRTWWKNAVVERRDPGTKWTESVLSELRRLYVNLEDDTIDLPSSLEPVVKTLVDGRYDKKQAEQRITESTAMITHAMAGHARGLLPNGVGIEMRTDKRGARRCVVQQQRNTP